MSSTQLNSALTHGLSSEQLSLIYDRERSIEQDFWRFDKANPQVYVKLVELAREVKRAGFEHYSMAALFHRIRWHYSFEAKSKEPFKLNDWYTAFYSRLIMSREPDLADFFEIRVQRSKRRKS